MTILAKVSLITGIIFMLMHLPCIINPKLAQKILKAFPRNKIMGWIFTAITLIWAAYLLNQTPLGRFDVIKDYLMIATPVAIGLVIYFMDELLSARALGGLFILLPAPMLTATRTSDSPLRLIIVVIAYVMAIAGMIFVLNPYKLRNLITKVLYSESSTRIVGLTGTIVGVLLVILSVTVY